MGDVVRNCCALCFQPTAAGSGIPLIKSYLNGVRVPGLLSLRCFIAKTVGVVLSILGGLACGKVSHSCWVAKSLVLKMDETFCVYILLTYVCKTFTESKDFCTKIVFTPVCVFVCVCVHAHMCACVYVCMDA